MKKGVFYDVKIALHVLVIYNAFIEEEVKLKQFHNSLVFTFCMFK